MGRVDAAFSTSILSTDDRHIYQPAHASFLKVPHAMTAMAMLISMPRYTIRATPH